MGLAERVVDALSADPGDVVVPPPGDGAGYWAGAPSVVLDDGVFWLAYRLRRPLDAGRGFANIVAWSGDGVRFRTVATIITAQLGCASLERPALIRRPDGGWRIYLSCATPDSKHWWVEALDAPTPQRLPVGTRTTVLAGDERSAWKDVVVRRDGDAWSMWACRHPLDGGEGGADRMSAWFATSGDGLAWSVPVPALAPEAEGWDRRGRRLTSVVPGACWTAFYDGRATAEENFAERTAGAEGDAPVAFVPVTGPTPLGRTVRYLSVVAVDGGHRLYWEASREDGAHELRTLLLPGLQRAMTRKVSVPPSPNQSR